MAPAYRSVEDDVPDVVGRGERHPRKKERRLDEVVRVVGTLDVEVQERCRPPGERSVVVDREGLGRHFSEYDSRIT